MVKIEGIDLMSLDLAIQSKGNLNLKLPLSILLTMRLLLERLADNAQWGRASMNINLNMQPSEPAEKNNDHENPDPLKLNLKTKKLH
jgi:hypothetical protein